MYNKRMNKTGGSMKDFYLQENKGVVTLKCRALDEVAGLRHGFSTRHGGVSEGYLATMNFTYNRESDENVEENFRRFSEANGLPYESLVLTQQTHTTNIAVIDASYKNRGRFRGLREIDGLVTAEPGLGLACFTADCVPILLADPQKRVIASVHAGWRGSVAGIAAEAVKKMVALGACAGNIIAAIGPSIGPCHFEVGPEVQCAFTDKFGKNLPIVPSSREGHTMVDLWMANRLILRECGVEDGNIHTAGICTYCRNEDFYSHRFTDGKRGLLTAIIAMEEP